MSNKKIEEKVEKKEEEEEEAEESESETKQQNNISIYKSLYPPIKESFILDENNAVNNKILKLNDELPLLRYKNTISSKNLKNIEDEISIILNEEEEEEEDLKMTDKFLEDLIKVPCPISKSKIIAIISNFIRKSKLIEKLESEYQSDKKADLNNLSILCAENLSYMELKKGEVIFKIGEFGNRFYFILKGFISILKLKEKPMIRMSYYQYFNYCIKLLKDKETYILEETLKKNYKKIPFTFEILLKIYKIIFQKKLYENLNKDVLYNNKLLLPFFSVHEQNIEHFGINIDELQNFELLKNYKEWKSYLIKKIKPTKEDLDLFDRYNRFVNSKSELLITCFCLDPFLYLGPGFFFGDNALEKGNIYTGGRRNATIRAETDVILGWLKGVDYVEMIEPKRRMEKLKEVSFLFNNFFFQEISIHLFEKNYFHLFSAKEFSRGENLFSTGVPPRALIFIKEGRISLEFKTSIINIHKLIKYLFDYIFTNPLFMGLARSEQKKLINNDIIRAIRKYINEPIFKKLRGFSQKFVDELNKDRKYNIAYLAENEIIGLQEIFLGIPYIMKGIVTTKKLKCYEITIEHMQKILYDEKEIMIPYIKTSINKILSLIERIQSLKQHYVNTFLQKYENGVGDEIKLNFKNSSSTYNLKNTNMNNNCYLKTQNSESNINNTKNDKIFNNIDNTILNSQTNNHNDVNIIESNNNNINNNFNANQSIFSENARTVSIPENKSPLKSYIYSRPESKKILTKLKKFRNSNITDNINIKLLTNKNKFKTRNYFNQNNKFQFPNIKKNKEITKSSEKVKSFFEHNEKKRKDVLIGNKFFSLKKLRNKFNEIDFLNIDNKDLVQVIQSTKYNNIFNNNNNNESNIINSSITKYENKIDPILKGRQKFLNYHLSYVPLYNLNDSNNNNNYNKESINNNYNTFNSESIDNTISSQLQIPMFSQYSTKENTKCNSFRKKINSRNFLNITNSNFGYNLNTLRSLSEHKENKKSNILSYYPHKINNEMIENEKYKGNIKEKIKDFYRDIKSKGCLSFLSNAENNTFFMRKFNKKYISAIKKNKSFKDKKCIKSEGSTKNVLPEIKELSYNKN